MSNDELTHGQVEIAWEEEREQEIRFAEIEKRLTLLEFRIGLMIRKIYSVPPGVTIVLDEIEEA